MNKDIKTNPCPEFPFFGATYPDARCIDGYLWDLDSCSDDPNVFHRGGECPCPFCNTDKFIEDDPMDLVDCILSEMTGDAPTHGQRNIAIDSARRTYLAEIEILREHYEKQRH